MNGYVFHEYPKWVTLSDGSQVIVDDALSEQALLAADEAEDGDDEISDSPAPKRRGRPPKARQ